jgi:hypothetical protein
MAHDERAFSIEPSYRLTDSAATHLAGGSRPASRRDDETIFGALFVIGLGYAGLCWARAM